MATHLGMEGGGNETCNARVQQLCGELVAVIYETIVPIRLEAVAATCGGGS